MPFPFPSDDLAHRKVRLWYGVPLLPHFLRLSLLAPVHLVFPGLAHVGSLPQCTKPCLHNHLYCCVFFPLWAARSRGAIASSSWCFPPFPPPLPITLLASLWLVLSLRPSTFACCCLLPFPVLLVLLLRLVRLPLSRSHSHSPVPPRPSRSFLSFAFSRFLVHHLAPWPAPVLVLVLVHVHVPRGTEAI